MFATLKVPKESFPKYIPDYILPALGFENRSLWELFRLLSEYALQPAFDLGVAGGWEMTLILDRVLPSPGGDQGGRLHPSLPA